MQKIQIKTTLNFLFSFFKDTPGLIEIRAILKDKTRAKRIFLTRKTLADSTPFLTTHSEWHLCFGVATRRNARGNAVLMLPALWADIDHKKLTLNGIPTPTITIGSGRGLHLYWMLEQPVNVAFTRQADNIQAILRGIAQKLNADIASTDIPRIMRIPGTLNPKYDPPQQCKILTQSRKKYPLSLFEPFKVPIRKKKFRPVDPSPDISDGIEIILQECEFIRWCRDNQPEVSEPLWYAMISNLAVHENGREIIHRFSCLHPKYSEKETDYKIKHALRDTRPHTCTYIQMQGFNCAGCKWNGTVRSPAGIPYVVLYRTRKIAS